MYEIQRAQRFSRTAAPELPCLSCYANPPACSKARKLQGLAPVQKMVHKTAQKTAQKTVLRLL